MGGRPGRRSRRLPGQCVFAFAHTTLMSSPLGALNGLAGAKPARANHSGGFGALGRSWQRRSLKLCVCSTLAVLSASVDSVAAEMKSGRTRVVLESEWRVGASLAVKASCHWKLLFEEKFTHTRMRMHACARSQNSVQSGFDVNHSAVFVFCRSQIFSQCRSGL